MGRLAFVFSGQGDQYPGMGKTLADRYPAAASVFALCDRIRPGTSGQCFGGTEEELRITENTQPCLYALELALAAALTEGGVRPDAAAGFSLGEVAAAAFAGLCDRETGFRLVCRRGQLMQREAERFDTSMAVVLRLTNEEVEEICSAFEAVYPVNYNCPGQVSVAALSGELPEFGARVKAAGGRLLPLKVNGAFHSPFMEEAAKNFAGELAKAELREGQLREGRIPLYSNLTGHRYGENRAELLSRQICSPVRWEQEIRNMIADGIDTFVEIGPGRTLTNMIKKIDANAAARTAAEYLEAMQ